MEPRYTIGRARAQDISRLAGIERAAAVLLRGHAPASVVDETTSTADFEAARAAGRLWVAWADDVPIGFALVAMLAADRPHLEELDVLPEHGRRGVGAALVRTVCEWAATAGHGAVTLTAFRDLAWNMPFYRRLGFQVLRADELDAELAAVVQEEASRGLDPRARVVMRFATR